MLVVDKKKTESQNKCYLMNNFNFKTTDGICVLQSFAH